MLEQEIAPCIVIYDNAFDKCQEVIDLALQQEMKNGEIESVDGSSVHLDIRNVLRTPIHVGFSQPTLWFELSKTIWEYGRKYSQRYEIDFDIMEPVDFLYYSVGGFYDLHQDAGRGQINRIFSSIIYLNDVEEGGNIYFPNFDIEIAPKSGRIAMFPSGYPYVHQAKPVTRGNKAAALTFFRLDMHNMNER